MAENYKHLYEQTKKMLTMYQDELIPGFRKTIADLEAKSKWISVKDRLPENDQWALCFMEDKSFGTFRVFQWNYIDWQWNDGNEWFDEKDVTHWMPLPQPPKGA